MLVIFGPIAFFKKKKLIEMFHSNDINSTAITVAIDRRRNVMEKKC